MWHFVASGAAGIGMATSDGATTEKLIGELDLEQVGTAALRVSIRPCADPALHGSSWQPQ